MQSDVVFVERPPAEAKRIAALGAEGGPTVITITPHGLEGPYADRLENDTSVFAWTTRMQMHAIAPRPPLRYAPYTPSIQVGTTASAAAMAAIWSREHAGPRRSIEVTSVEALAGNVDSFFVTWAFSGAEMPRVGGQSQAAYVAGAYACKDGHLVFASGGNPFFSRLCEGIGHPELATDPRFSDPLQKPLHWADFMEYLQPWLDGRTRNEVFTHLQSFGVMVAPVLTVAELLEDAQAVARGAFADVEQPLVGKNTIAGPPFHLDGSWEARPSPRLGEHTADILEELGYSATERVALFKAGVAT
jgi:crotonobetainyl-CoA:carnitine CoA-transferase CaiB-like acyl-CoA transferase